MSEIPETVAGIDVVGDEPVETNLSKPGSPRYYSTIRKLNLADGSHTFVCVGCGDTGSSPAALRGHASTHRASTRVRRNTANLDVSLAELIGAQQRADTLQGALDRVTAERDDLKERLAAAEGALKTIRTAVDKTR